MTFLLVIISQSLQLFKIDCHCHNKHVLNFPICGLDCHEIIKVILKFNQETMTMYILLKYHYQVNFKIS